MLKAHKLYTDARYNGCRYAQRDPHIEGGRLCTERVII